MIVIIIAPLTRAPHPREGLTPKLLYRQRGTASASYQNDIIIVIIT